MTSAFCGGRIKMRRMNCGVRFKKRTNAAATILGVVEKRQLESDLFVFKTARPASLFLRKSRVFSWETVFDRAQLK